MLKRMLAVFVLMVATAQCQAGMLTGVSSFFSKFFKAGQAAKEAVVVEHATEGAKAGSTSASGFIHRPVGDVAPHSSSTSHLLVDPKPDFSAEPVAVNAADAVAYKAQRSAAAKGDNESMFAMSELTSSGKVFDPGEPYRSYWLIQAARSGNQYAVAKLKAVCPVENERRRSDQLFDAACSSATGDEALYKN